MKLKKITDSEMDPAELAAKRWYNDACGAAFALELVGERWSILVMRELMFGPRRFGELKAGLPGISANILTQRLTSLEQERILFRRKLPPPASAQVYELTEWGYLAEPILSELGRWATRSPEHNPTLPFSAASAMLSFRTMLSRERQGDLAATIGFRFDDDGFVATLDARGITIVRADPTGTDVVFDTMPPMLAGAVYGGVPLAVLEDEGVMQVTGDRDLAERFVTLFPLPPKLGVE
jgi:DNA-binding HxlR family transcriptional regulator